MFYLEFISAKNEVKYARVNTLKTTIEEISNELQDIGFIYKDFEKENTSYEDYCFKLKVNITSFIYFVYNIDKCFL